MQALAVGLCLWPGSSHRPDRDGRRPRRGPRAARAERDARGQGRHARARPRCSRRRWPPPPATRSSTGASRAT
ncbi:MAG: hypothetical protein MZV64_35260 [Ignavibacteriales bacterium]|nr:hypothetical protein [Ignavibacteriales bacterium]